MSNKQGNLINDLEEEDFALIEDVRHQTPHYISAEAEKRRNLLVRTRST